MAFFVVLILGLFSGLLSSTVASDKGHDGTAWFLVGLLLGPLGLIASAGLSDRKLRRYLRQIGEKQDAIKPHQDREQKSKNKSVGSFVLPKEANEKEVFEKLVELLEKKNYSEVVRTIDKKKLDFNSPLFVGRELIVQDENGETLVFVSTSGSLPEGLMWQVELI